MCSNQQASESGVVRLVVPQEISRSFLCGVVMRFTARFPEIKLEVRFTREVSGSEQFDLALTSVVWSNSGQGIGKIPVGRRWLFASPGYVEEHPAIGGPLDLSSHQCILESSGTNTSQTWSLTGPRGLEPVLVTGAVRANDCSFTHQLILRSTGIGILPATLGLDDLRVGKLARVLPEYEVSGSGLRLVVPVASRLSRRVALVREALMHALTSAKRSSDAAHLFFQAAGAQTSISSPRTH